MVDKIKKSVPKAKTEILEAYQRNAGFYDPAVKFFYPLIGLRIEKYRRRAVECLNLSPGDTVIDLGCGTGLCFPLLIDKVGPEGLLIGVDMSSEMLSRASVRVKRAGWPNVRLENSDIERYKFPNGINGVIATGVFGYIEARRQVIKNIAGALADDGRLVIVDGKRPTNWARIFFEMFVWLAGPFGLTEAYFDSETWRIVEDEFEETLFEEMYGGFLYISAGEKPIRA